MPNVMAALPSIQNNVYYSCITNNIFIQTTSTFKLYLHTGVFICFSHLLLAALHSRCGHCILSCFFLLFFPRLSSAVADWMSTYLYTWCGPSANLECRSEMCFTQLAGNAGPKKNRQKFAIWTPSHNFVGLYLRN